MNKASGHESHQCEKKGKKKRKKNKEEKSASEGEKKQGGGKEEGKIERGKERIRVRAGNVKSSFLSQSAAHCMLSVAMLILN